LNLLWGLKKHAWDCTANKISEGWDSVKCSAWMTCAYCFKCDEWINAKVNEDRKYYSDLQEKMINANIRENKAQEVRLNSLLKSQKRWNISIFKRRYSSNKKYWWWNIY
jgi:hypothetical protein